ncbi:MAG TPA: GrpB family protein [Vicinamibacterales bacterium]|jgi:GrpB-like predicted nucleotidyltransferase (UPF0157 family)|nr:GrpB family protein [Vicinamibacterales bacterium]
MNTDSVEFVDGERIGSSVLSVFEELRITLEEVLPAAEIEHVGSTAIPGAVTKGDLDVCVLVDASAFREADRVLAERFARNVGSDQTESLSSFVDESKPVPVGVQLVVRGGTEDFFVRWRDLLRRSPQVLSDYNQLKRRWHGGSHEGYRAAKSTFIEDTLRASGVAG